MVESVPAPLPPGASIESALRASEARLRATFDNSAVGMVENALDGSWLNVNPRMCEITGYSREAFLGLDFRDLTHPDDRIDERPMRRRLLKGELPYARREKRYLRADGSTIWVAVSTSAVRDSDGRGLYFVSVIEDIAERKRIEAELASHRLHLEAEVEGRTLALQKSEHFLRSVADNLPDMIGYWDAKGVLRFANRSWRDWFSPGADPLGAHRLAVLGADEVRATQPMFDAAMAGRAQRFEQVLTSAAGEVRYALGHYIPDRQGDRVAGLFVLLADISEAKQAELRLQAMNEQLVAARDRAEAANRAKSAFLANISHEIRTPMNAIIGLTHLMRREAGAGAGADRLVKISDAAQHLLDVINDVLDLSKIESGKLRLEKTDFPVDAVLTRACALVAERARAKGLELVLQSDGVPKLLHGDPTRVSQALLNLMTNAVKFTDHGSIVLRCEPVATESDSDADVVQLRFSVQDTGVGVPADKVADLFNAFEQADTSTTRRFGGTGLGLAITRHLAQLMDGDVGVQTAQGKGSCFWFTASFDRVSQPFAQDRTTLPGRRVLVADDLPVARAALADLLRRLGMQVDCTDAGDKAVQAALAAVQRGRPYELLLLDAEMPGTDGVAALRQLQARLGAAELPPCLLIFDGDPARPPDLTGLLGAVETQAKPVTLSALSIAIDKLDRQPWQRPALHRTEVLPNERALLERVTSQRVLLAEDNLINQEVARELLQAVGMQVDLANDGKEAVNLAAEHDYDLVLMDMQMPVMDGLDAARALRAMPRHARTPILAMTANAFGDDRLACLAAGMDDHIAKPVDPELLYGMLCRWLPARVDEPTVGEDTVPLPVNRTINRSLEGRASAQGAERPALQTAATAPDLAEQPMPDFNGIAGLTMARALLYLPGRDQVFARVLRKFCENYGRGVPDLDAALQARQWAEARRLLHALRGACGAVGATTVQSEALTLELQLQALDGGDSAVSSPSAKPLQHALQALIGEVQTRLAAAAAARPASQ